MNRIFSEKFVVLDLETTGNQPRLGDQIIQIGLCIIAEGKIVEQYATLVKPTKQIPPFIENLTGITNQAVEQAPSIEEVIPELLVRLDQAVLIAHNIHFDLSFLQHVLEDLGYTPFSGLILDTVELARVLLPMQQGYRLEQLAEDFDLIHINPHQADSDAFATAQLFLALMEKMYQLPLVTIQRLIPLARSLYSDLEVLLRRVEREKLLELQLAQGVEEQEWVIKRQLALKKKRKEEGEQLRSPVYSEQIELPFGKMLQEAVPDYEQRDGQEELSLLIKDAFINEKHGLFEVGTGTGKTMAYLYSAVAWAKQKNVPVVISTYTLLLQEQIINKEIPKLKKALPVSFSAQVLKGRHHYLCLRKFEAALFSNTDHNYDVILTKMKILVWLTLTDTGDVEEINLPTGGREFWQVVRSEASSCQHQRCPWYQHCFYFQAKQKAERADLIITNHALLLADAQADNHILPTYDFVIIDEAHHLEHMATEQFGQSSQYRQLHYLINRLTLAQSDFLSQQILDFLPLVTTNERVSELMHQFTTLAEQIRMYLADLYTLAVDFAEKNKDGYTEGNIRQVPVRPNQEPAEGTWQLMVQHAEQQQVTLLEMKCVQEQFLEELHTETVLSYAEQGIITDWNGLIERLSREITQLNHFFKHEQTEELIKWIEYELKGAKNSATLVQQPLHVSPALGRYLFEAKKSVILTSASLQINGSFEYMLTELGLPLERVNTCRIPSPFNYATQATILIPKHLPSLSKVSEEIFLNEVAADLIELAKLTQGRMLVLFTSYHSLKVTYRQIKEALYSEGIFCFAQGIDSSSRGKLTKNFQSKEKAVLLGTSSFWEGIDLPGEDLSCLVIVKLPFSPPNTPYNLAKAKHLQAQGKNLFKDFSLPQAIIRFKQGFGRLIRKRTDKGIIVIYDRRIIEAGYGKLFLKSLPDLEIEQVDKEGLRAKVEFWLT